MNFFTHPTRRLSLLVVAFLLLLPATQALQITDDEIPNFQRVNDRLYRGGQPRKGEMRNLAELGVNTIINLRNDDDRAEAEAEEVESAGMRYYNVPFKRVGRPTDSQVDQVLALINAPENGVVFVHCQHGADRTGLVIGIYRIVNDGWTDREAIREAVGYGMKFWQRRMKDYISDYYRDIRRQSRNRNPALERKR